MPITQEELDQKPPALQLIPMEDESDPHRFAVLLRFRCGLNQVWTFRAPPTPIDDEYLKHAMQILIQSVVEDLRDGKSEPEIRRNPQAFQEFEWSANSVAGSLNKLLVEWARKRVKWATAMAAPTIIQ